MTSPAMTPPGTADPGRATRWVVAGLVIALYAWPLLAAAALHGMLPLVRSLTGDSYHYLAIARKSLQSGFYTYDGITVTNGFHPLWEYTLRGLFQLLGVRSHLAQAVTAVGAALVFSAVGFALTAVAIAQLTGEAALGLLVLPGVYYLLAGVHVNNLSAWAMLDGMESSLSVLCAGLLLFVLATNAQRSEGRSVDLLGAAKGIGAVAPLVVLARLDDVFLVIALAGACLLTAETWKARLAAATWIAAPSAAAVFAYLAYNQLTAGAAMPLSGGTKAGFALPLNLYLTAAVHFPPLLDLKELLTGRPSNGAEIWANSFRFVEMLYPALLAAFGIALIWRRRERDGTLAYIYMGLCGYVVLKFLYNFVMVHPWHQSGWYYAVSMLMITFLGAIVARQAWLPLTRLGRAAAACVYLPLVLLSGAEYYNRIVYADQREMSQIWRHKDEIRAGLVAAGVHGVLNVDDGITAFLLDLPNIHGFAFATDVAAQKAFRSGKLLTLAQGRHVDAIAGLGYLASDAPPTTDAAIREFLMHSVARDAIEGEADQYTFSLAYFDREARLPFFSFHRRPP